MAQGDDRTLACTDGCGRRVHDEEQALRMGWWRLQITGRYRCPQCAMELEAINRRSGSASDDPDKKEDGNE